MEVEWVHSGEERRWEKLGWTVITEPRGCVSMFLFKQNVTSGNWRIKDQNPLSEIVWAGVTWEQLSEWVSVELH